MLWKNISACHFGLVFFKVHKFTTHEDFLDDCLFLLVTSCKLNGLSSGGQSVFPYCCWLFPKAFD